MYYSEKLFENPFEIDEDVIDSDISTDNYITDSVRSTIDIDDIDKELSDPILHVSVKQLKTAFIMLRTFREQSINVNNKI